VSGIRAKMSEQKSSSPFEKATTPFALFADSDRMKEIARLFGLDGGAAKSHLREIGKKPQAKALKKVRH
jgi:hypothetical protein